MKNNRIKLLITGGNGQIASALIQHPRADDYVVMPCSSQEVDITQASAIENAITRLHPDIIINTAAYTAVDKAEQESDRANRVNHLGAKQLAMASSAHRIPLIHLSTDYIFDGESHTPYREDDQSNPINVYGQSKWLGEEAVREQANNYCILRVSGVFSEFGHNFFKTILRLAKEKSELRIVADQITCPTYAGDIANAIFTLATQHARGTYHFCSQQSISWHQLAATIIALAKEHTAFTVKEIVAITTADYPTPAKRPCYSVLDCSKLFSETGIAQPSLENGIINALAGMQP